MKGRKSSTGTIVIKDMDMKQDSNCNFDETTQDVGEREADRYEIKTECQYNIKIEAINDNTSFIKQEDCKSESNDNCNDIADKTVVYIKQEPDEFTRSYTVDIKPEEISEEEEDVVIKVTDLDLKYSTCNYKTSNNCNSTCHLTKDTGEKPFSCTFTLCNHKYSSKRELNCHLKIHSVEKPFSCSYCKYKCVEKMHLIRHLKNHAREKTFSCSFCEYKTAWRTYLTRHVRIHTGEKPFNCRFCDYKSSRKFSVRDHEKIHSGERPNCCAYCEFKCVSKSLLNRHLRAHTGEMPSGCRSKNQLKSNNLSARFVITSISKRVL